MSKSKELMRKLTSILEDYPDLQKVIMDDTEDPSYIILCEDEIFEQMLSLVDSEDDFELVEDQDLKKIKVQ